MGRLFWKFFFSFWLTLLAAAISTGSFVWLKHATDDDPLSRDERLIDFRGIPYVQVAADIGRTQGLNALSAFLTQSQQTQLINLMAVNSDNQDLLGRRVDVSALSQARQLMAKGKDRIVEQIRISDQNWLLYAPLAEPEKAPGPLFKKSWVLKHLPLLMIISSALLASLFFSAVLAWYFTRPISRLKQAFQSVADGKLDTRVGTKMKNRRDELAELGQNFDFMTSRISSLVNGQRQLLHDVSHELRSPLARMQAAIGIAQQQPDKVANTLSRLEKEAERMSDLVGELLLLSRLETGVTHNQPAEIDINLLLDEIVADARFEAEAKSIHILYQHDGHVTLQGQQELLHRAIENVLRNAIKFSDGGDHISLRAHLDADTTRFSIVIEDEGPGVSEADLDKLFRPFFRGEPQRRDGIGLGLTIAQRAVAAHGGQIEAENRAEGGLRIRISLPV
jgi:two-component system OmpR family sensor kinase